MFNLDKFSSQLETIVNIDSGSYDVEGTTRIAQWFADRLEALGWEATWFDPKPNERGKSVFLSPAGVQEWDLLIVCHVDTVFPKGEVAKRPFSKDEKRFYGPGVGDMKAGCLFTLHAIEDLLTEQAKIGRIGVIFNTEEEISSINTRPMIESYCRRSRITITAEPSRPDGANVNRRKGINRYTLTFEGKSAHAGNNPQEGICTNTEMAHWILFFKSLENLPQGITVNPGIAKGGISANVVADKAELHVDVRSCTYEDALVIDKAVRAHQPTNPRVKVSIQGGITRPPMVPNVQSQELEEVVQAIDARLGLETKWVFAGGGSDASFASALGKPALCALGPVCGKAHSKEEYVEIGDLALRYEKFKEVVRLFSTHQFKSV